MTFRLTTKEKVLLRAVQKGDGEGGIYGLAAALDRDPRRVFDNVSRLESNGYVMVSTKLKNGREIKSVTPAVTGSVMTVVNVSLPEEVTVDDLVAGLNKPSALLPGEQIAVMSFFGEVPASLAQRFLKEHGISLAQAANAYASHVKPFQKLSQAERWLNAAPGLGRHTP